MERPPHAILDEISLLFDVHDLKISEPIPGGSHNVYVLNIPSGEKWSLRIAKDEFAASLASRSVAIMRHIKQLKPTLQIPAVVHSAECYTLLRYIDGAPIGSWNSQKFNDERRHRILDGLAVFLYELWTCPAPIAGSGVSTMTTTTYRDWLLDEVDKAICRALRSSGWGDPVHLFHRRAKVDGLLPRHGNVGIAIKHGDMNALNVLVNEDGLAGVIDWDTASFVPNPAAIQYPLFIAGIPGFRNDDVPEDKDFADDRAYLVDAIRKLCVGAGRFADLLDSSWERQFFELSLRNKRINEEYIRLRLGGADFDTGALGDQLDEFVSANREMGNDSAIIELRRQLS